MIKIIYGAKGVGKTKKIIDLANDSLAEQKGDIVFIADTNRYMHDIKYQIRFTNTKESVIESQGVLIGFIKGMISANYDIKVMFIDGAARMINQEINDMQPFFEEIEAISENNNVDFVLTISKEINELPDFIKKYV